jgi:hypothetical protein
MSYVPPSWTELSALANDALVATAEDVVLPANPYGMPIEIGLAASARSRRLLLGIMALIEGGLGDICGVLIRALYESWLVGLFGLLGGPDALERLVDQQTKHLKPIRAVLGDESGEEGRSLPVAQLAERASKLMEQRRMPNPQFAIRGYETLYRWESYRNTHGGLGSVEGHLVRYEDRVEVRRERPEDDDHVRHRVFTAVAIYLSGAQIVAIEAGWDHENLDQIADRIHAFDPNSSA